jgi:hypothetical protein
MNWYVSFAREDLSRLTAGDFLNLQEQITAIWYKLRYLDQSASRLVTSKPQPLPSREQIEQLQGTVSKHLSEIADQGATSSDPYTITRFIHHVSGEHEDYENGIPLYEFDFWRSQVFITGRQENVFKDYLVHHLFDLLREHAQSVRRCPHCSQVFLQLRRHATYCSRACQSVATMKKRRTGEADKETTRPKKGKPSRTRSKRMEAR